MNAKGLVIAQMVIEHSSAGFQKLDERRRQLSLRTSECIADLETPHELLTYYLWCHEYTQVYFSRRLR